MPSAFGVPAGRVTEVGTSLGGSSGLLDMTLAGVACVPPTGNLLDVVVDLTNSPAALSAPGTLDLRGALPLMLP